MWGSLVHYSLNLLSPYLRNLLEAFTLGWMRLYCQFIKWFLLSYEAGRWLGPNQAILHVPRKDENFTYPTYKLRKNRMDSLTTTCSAQFCVGSPATPSQCRSEHLPVATQLPSVMCGLLSLILSPRAEPRVYFYAEWTLSSGRATCVAANSARWQTSSCTTAPTPRVCSPHIHPHTGTTCLSTWRDVACQQSQAGGAVGNQDTQRREKPRHSCEQWHAAQFNRNFTWSYLKPLQTSLFVLLLMHFPPSTHSKTTHILW